MEGLKKGSEEGNVGRKQGKEERTKKCCYKMKFRKNEGTKETRPSRPTMRPL